MARNRPLSFNLRELLADKEAAYEFLREYAGLAIADKIRSLRAEHNLKQADLAQLLGTTQSAVARLEDEDYRKYSLSTLQKIAEVVDLWPTVVFEPYQAVIGRILSGREMEDLHATHTEKVSWWDWLDEGSHAREVHTDLPDIAREVSTSNEVLRVA